MRFSPVHSTIRSRFGMARFRLRLIVNTHNRAAQFCLLTRTHRHQRLTSALGWAALMIGRLFLVLIEHGS